MLNRRAFALGAAALLGVACFFGVMRLFALRFCEQARCIIAGAQLGRLLHCANQRAAAGGHVFHRRK